MDEDHSKMTLLPPKPEEPLDSECCGTGCTPCVFDIYKEKLKRWEEECERIESGEAANNDCDTNSLKTNEIISPYEYKDFTVNAIVKDCKSCKIISFKRANAESTTTLNFSKRNFPVKLGQHVVLKIQEKTRQYTVLDVRKDGCFTIVFKIYESGLLTQLIDKLVEGSEVKMRGPFGKEFMYKPNEYAHLNMIAAGSGIAPFYQIIEKVLENDCDETRIVLAFACKNENEILLVEKIKEWSRSWNFQVSYFLSNVQDQKKAETFHYGTKVICGKITKTVIENIVSQTKVNNNLYFICGTKSFDKDVLNYLKSVGVHEEKIKLF